MQYLLRNKVVLFIILLTSVNSISFAQFEPEYNLPNHDDKLFHFGISLGSNRSFYHFDNNPYFTSRDSVLGIESLQSSGVSLAWLVDMNLNEHFNLRTYPLDLIFTEKAFEYRLRVPEKYYEEDSITIKKVQGITLALPVQIKFNSDRINNLKVYMLAGGKLEYDFAGNAGDKNAERQIKLKKLDYGVEAGIGFHFYFPMFVLSPELKVGWGLNNVHSRDENLKYSNVIDQIKSRTISFSFIIE